MTTEQIKFSIGRLMKKTFVSNISYEGLKVSEVVDYAFGDILCTAVAAISLLGLITLLISSALTATDLGLLIYATMAAFILSTWGVWRLATRSKPTELRINSLRGIVGIGELDNSGVFYLQQNLKISQIDSVFLMRNNGLRKNAELKIRMKDTNEIFPIFCGDKESLEAILKLIFSTVRVSDQRERARTARTARFLSVNLGSGVMVK